MKSVSENETAQQNRAKLRAAGVFAVNLIGGMGSGKSSLISAAGEHLADYRIATITADPFSTGDICAQLQLIGAFLPIDPRPSTLLKPSQVQRALNKLDLDRLDLIFIESLSGFIGACTTDLGENAKVSIFSVAAGDGRAAGFSAAIQYADLIALNKIDMFSVMPFDRTAFRNEIGRLNPKAKLIELSTLTSQGLDQWVDWLKSRVAEARQESAIGGNVG